MARWTPVIKDIMEDLIDDKLDQNYFPFLVKRPGQACSVAKSARFWQTYKPQGPNIRKVPRLIVFIVGGMSYSEMRCAYEISNKDWEVICGSTHILTPEGFLNDLGAINNYNIQYL